MTDNALGFTAEDAEYRNNEIKNVWRRDLLIQGTPTLTFVSRQQVGENKAQSKAGETVYTNLSTTEFVYYEFSDAEIASGLYGPDMLKVVVYDSNPDSENLVRIDSDMFRIQGKKYRAWSGRCEIILKKLGKEDE